MHNKVYKSGFSLVEVIIAVLILGLSVGAIFKFQGQLIRGTFLAHGLIERLPVIKNMFEKVEEERLYEKKEPTKIEDNETNTTVTYTKSGLPEGSAFKGIDNLYLERVDAKWPGLLTTQEQYLIGLRFSMPGGKSEK